jgi:hypothetical protein
VTIEPDGGFTARLLAPAEGTVPDVFGGRWLAARGLLLTAVTIVPKAAS